MHHIDKNLMRCISFLAYERVIDMLCSRHDVSPGIDQRDLYMRAPHPVTPTVFAVKHPLPPDMTCVFTTFPFLALHACSSTLYSAFFFSLQSFCLMLTGKPTGVAVSYCIAWPQTQLIFTACQIHMSDPRPQSFVGSWGMGGGQGCIGREGTSAAAPEAVRQAV